MVGLIVAPVLPGVNVLIVLLSTPVILGLALRVRDLVRFCQFRGGAAPPLAFGIDAQSELSDAADEGALRLLEGLGLDGGYLLHDYRVQLRRGRQEGGRDKE